MRFNDYIEKDFIPSKELYYIEFGKVYGRYGTNPAQEAWRNLAVYHWDGEITSDFEITYNQPFTYACLTKYKNEKIEGHMIDKNLFDTIMMAIEDKMGILLTHDE